MASGSKFVEANSCLQGAQCYSGCMDTRAGIGDGRAAIAAHLGLLLATLFWAGAFVAGKVALAEMTPLAVSAWRYAFAALLLLPFGYRAWPAATVLRPMLAPLAVLVACGGVLYPWLFLAALERTSATNASLLIALNPVLTIVMAPLIGEALHRARIVGAGLALCGAAVVITRGELGRLGELTSHSGDLLALGAAATWACFNLTSRRVVARMTSASINLAVYGLGGIALFALSAGEGPVMQLARASPPTYVALFVLAALASVFAGQLFLGAVRLLGVSRTVVYINLVPPTTAVLSWMLLGEAMVFAQAAGGAAVLLGVYLASRPPR